jgi:dTDP-4-dehydrorhamnose 3,5-epimerase
MIDLALDIRRNSPYYGKVLGYEMRASSDLDFGEWIWVPPGFAHGNVFLEETSIEYFCSGEYNPHCEAGISPLAADLDWSMCDSHLQSAYNSVVRLTPAITEKDRNGLTLAAWSEDPRSFHFVYSGRDEPHI